MLLTRGRVDHIDSLDCINSHISSSSGILKEAYAAHHKPPSLRSADVNMQLYKEMGMDTMQIERQINQLNTVYNTLIKREMSGLL